VWAAPEQCWRRISSTAASATRPRKRGGGCAGRTTAARSNPPSNTRRWSSSRRSARRALRRALGALSLAAAGGGLVDARIELLDALAQLGDLVGERIAQAIGGGAHGLVHAAVELLAIVPHARLQLLREMLRFLLGAAEDFDQA